MNKLVRKSLGILAILAGLMTSAAADTRYFVEDLGALRGDYETTPWGINTQGDVVGSSMGPKGHRAFLFIDGAGMIELPAIARGASSVARDINDHGMVVGQSNFRAVVWDLSGQLSRDFGPNYLDKQRRVSEAMSVNSLGEIAGWFGDGRLQGGRHAFVFNVVRGMVDITPLGTAEANDINDVGQVAGVQNGRAFIWGGGKIMYPDVLPGLGLSNAYGINAFSELVGSMTSTGFTSQHAFKFYTATGLQDLGGHGDRNMLRRINTKGQSVGQGRLADNVLQALIHSDSDGLQALNDLIAAPSEWFVDFATDINDYGVIVATAWNGRSRTRHAVKLIPAPAEYCLQGCARSDEN